MLELTSVTRQYRGADAPAVESVSLSVKEGEVVALVGESGSGKTTLLRLIAGLEIPDGGEISIDGSLVANAGGHAWVPPEKRRVGFVFQEGALFPHLTVADNVAYGLPRRDRAGLREAIDHMLGLVGLNGFEKRYPHELSGGERQRLAVARALAPRPKVILLDEPFSNLDPALRHSLREEIQNILTQVNATAIMVTHDTEDALAVGDQVAIFRSARIEQSGTPSELYNHPKNGYCARLFGPANHVALEDGAVKWIRPDDMHLVDNADSALAIPVQVRSIRDACRRIEAVVEAIDPAVSNDERWTVCVDSDLKIKEGEKAWVTCDARS